MNNNRKEAHQGCFFLSLISLSISVFLYGLKSLILRAQPYLTAFHVVITNVKPEEDLEGYLKFFFNRESEIHRSYKICPGYSREW